MIGGKPMNTEDFKLDVEQANEIRRAATSKHEARRVGTKLTPRITPKRAGVRVRLTTKRAPKRVEGFGGRRLPKKNLPKGNRLGGRLAKKQTAKGGRLGGRRVAKK